LAKHRRSLILAAFLALLLTGGGLWLHAWLFVDLPPVDDLSASLYRPSIRIVDRQGRLLYEVIGAEEGRHTVAALESIPRTCIEATIATEDAHFYTNPGVDSRAILRALWTNLRGGEVLSGGSTITQQVARNLLLTPEERTSRTLQRKMREAVLAFRLARRYSKDHILALYLNQTYYGNLAYGIDAAARAYFGKPVSELGLAECALLAGLPQAPAIYDPLTDPIAAKERQAIVLGLMAANGYITPEEAESAELAALAFASERYDIEAPHFVFAVYDHLAELLPAETLQTGGLVVRTTLDLDWQHAAETIAQRHLQVLNQSAPGEPPHNAHDAALVALDPYTGQVLALLGSPDYFDASISGAIDMTQMPRQPGSTLKPFTYALTFDPACPQPWTPATMLLDVRTAFVTRQGFSYAPVNYDLQEHGPVLVREALASSYNIPAVIALDAVGPAELIRLLHNLGLTTLNDPTDYDLSLTLGGGEVRLLELVAAFAAFANGGRSVHPVFVLDVTDATGQAVYTAQNGLGGQVIDERVSWLITDILSDNLARAPAFTTHSVLQIGRPAAVKTGTTTDFRDNWTIGYTPNLAVGVWVGNADNSAMINVSGVSGAGPIWHEFTRSVLRGQPELDFVRPEDMVQVEVCSLSGLLPTPDCPYTRLEWFIPGTEPREYDAIYQHITVDRLTGLPATDDTPPERLENQLVLDLPAEAQAWARQAGLPLLSDLPSAFAYAEDGIMDLILISPEPQTIFRIDPVLPPDIQQVRFLAAAPSGAHDVTFFVDGIPLAVVNSPPFQVWWTLTPGEHTISASGYDGSDRVIQSSAVSVTVNPHTNTHP
jgi:penicillin-binding protein 1C